MSSIQSTAPAERQVLTDETTGRQVIRWTASPARDQHPYFTSPAVTADDRFLLILSERSGAPNLHVIDRGDGRIRQLTDADAMLRAYCYPTGTTRGLSKATPFLDATRRHAYWVQDDAAWRIDLAQGQTPEKLADLPAGWYTGFTHLSPDGGTFCVPCTDPRAFRDDHQSQGDQMGHVPWAMIEQGLVTRLCMIDTQHGQVRDKIEIPFWVTHVQFDPASTGRLLFNCEGMVGGGADRRFPYWGRMWALEPDGRWRRLYEQPASEHATHENWMPDGRTILYHGVRDGEHFIAGRDWAGELVFERSTGGVAVYHAVATPDPTRVTVDSRDGLVYLFDLDAPAHDCARPLCSHRSSYRDQDAHAHPVMTASQGGVVFTSDRAGTCDVYEVAPH